MRWWTRCWKSIAGSLVAAVAAGGGCVKKEHSEKDRRRLEVADLERVDGAESQLAGILADKREDELVRAQAAASLGRMPGGGAFGDVLIRACAELSSVIRRDAIEACGVHRLEAARATMEDHLVRDRDADVRRAAAVALGRLGRGESVGALVAALDDRDLGVQQMAVESLRRITGQQFGRDAAAWKSWSAKAAPPVEPGPR